MGDVHGATKPKRMQHDEKKQFMRMMEVCELNCMIQAVEEPTRENTLDILFTNEI